jgi:hypothetical protein
LISSITPESSLAARKAIEAVLAADPQSADASARLALVLMDDYLHDWNEANKELVVRAIEAVSKALKINPELALAVFANGLVARARGERARALG